MKDNFYNKAFYAPGYTYGGVFQYQPSWKNKRLKPVRRYCKKGWESFMYSFCLKHNGKFPTEIIKFYHPPMGPLVPV